MLHLSGKQRAEHEQFLEWGEIANTEKPRGRSTYPETSGFKPCSVFATGLALAWEVAKEGKEEACWPLSTQLVCRGSSAFAEMSTRSHVDMLQMGDPGSFPRIGNAFYRLRACCCFRCLPRIRYVKFLLLFYPSFFSVFSFSLVVGKG